MPHSTPFGVGSFHFGWQPPAAGKATVSAYVNALERALNSVHTIDNVQIDQMELHPDEEYSPEGGGDWSEGDQYYPPLTFFDLSFDLKIPKRLQDELFKALGRPYAEIGTGTETFRIYQTYTYHAPVTFVCPRRPSHDQDPSTCVVLVREYLKREFANAREGISFECLGPSPFHADFFLRDGGQGLSKEDPFVGSIVEEAEDYDQVLILYDAQIYASPDEAMRDVLSILASQLGFAYAVYAGNARAIYRWAALSQDVDSLVRPGPLRRGQRFKRWLLRGSALSRVHQTLRNSRRQRCRMIISSRTLASSSITENIRFRSGHLWIWRWMTGCISQ